MRFHISHLMSLSHRHLSQKINLCSEAARDLIGAASLAVACTLVVSPAVAQTSNGADALNIYALRVGSNDVVVFERDKGIYGDVATRQVDSNAASQVDSETILFPREQAIGTEGKVVIHRLDRMERKAVSPFYRH